MHSTTFTTLHNDDGDCNTTYLKQCSKWRVDYKIEFCDCNESWLSTAFPGVIDCFSQLSSSLPLLCGLTNVDTGIMIGLMHIWQKHGILEATMKWSSDSESRKTCARCIYSCMFIDSRQKICYQFIWFRSISQFQKILKSKMTIEDMTLLAQHLFESLSQSWILYFRRSLWHTRNWHFVTNEKIIWELIAGM